MAIAYVGAGVNHFISPEFYLPMMPPWLPAPEALLAISGLAEILLGVGVLVPMTRRLAAWGVVALLIAVFPANLHMALADVHDMPLAFHIVRLPLQAVLVLWAYWYTRADFDAEPT